MGIRKLLFLILCILLVTFLPAAAEVTPSLVINNEEMGAEHSPILQNNRTIAPIRVISEYLGAEVNWDGETKTVTIRSGEDIICLTINNPTVDKNGEKISLDIAPQIINSRTYVPLRFVSEALGHSVFWDGILKRVSITAVVVEPEDDPAEQNPPTGEMYYTQALTGIEVNQIGDSQQIRIKLTGSAPYKTMILPYPDRYVLDFPETLLTIPEEYLDIQSMFTLELNDRFIYRVRSAQFQTVPTIARVVLDLKDVYGDPIITRDGHDVLISYVEHNPDMLPKNDLPPDAVINDQNLPMNMTLSSVFLSTKSPKTFTVEGVAAADKEQFWGKISGSAVNLRLEPTTTEENVLITLPRGTVLEVIGQSTGWYQVLYKGQIAWIADYLLDVGVEMKRHMVNVRNAPSLSAKVLDTIERGTKIEIIGRTKAWERVRLPSGIEGYIADYLIAFNERFLEGLHTGVNVADKLLIRAKNTGISEIVSPKLPMGILSQEFITDGTDLLWQLNLDQAYAYRHLMTNEGLQVDIGSRMQEVRVSEAVNKVVVDIYFDAPTRFTFKRNDSARTLDLEFAGAKADEEQVFPLQSNIASSVAVLNNGEGMRLSMQMGRYGSYKISGGGYDTHFRVELLSPSLMGKIIALDPGHGGSDSGAAHYGVKESDLVLSIALKLRDLLQEGGAIVLMTRETDERVSLSERTTFANQHNADIFISIHANSSSGGTPSGTESFYYPKPEDERLAQEMLNGLLRSTGFRSRGCRSWPNLYVTKHTEMPATLLEVGFLNNASERAFMTSEIGKRRIAEELFRSIEIFFMYQ